MLDENQTSLDKFCEEICKSLRESNKALIKKLVFKIGRNKAKAFYDQTVET